jgi:hypothetical protein
LVPIGVAAGAMTLGDIVPNANFAAFEDFVQVFTSSGSTALKATYVSQATLEDWDMWPGYDVGWYDYADGNMQNGTLDDTVLAFGTSMTVFSGSTGATLLYVGEVVQNDVEFPLAENGYTAIGNASPVELTLGDIVPNANFAAFEDFVQIFTASGSTALKATYVSQATLEDWDMWPGYDVGWYDYADGNMQNGTLDDTVIPAGQGMTVFSGSANAAITIPNPIPVP